MPLVITITPNPGLVHRPVSISVAGASCDPHDVKVSRGTVVLETFEENDGASSQNTFVPTQTGGHTVTVVCGEDEEGSITFDVN
ncbi:MAG: hypothetical protein ACF8XB_18130 [Planctomycetota bacterium JB042]